MILMLRCIRITISVVKSSFSYHFVSDGFIVLYFCWGVIEELGLGEIDAITGYFLPLDLRGVFIEVIGLYHFINDFIAKHVISFFFEIGEKGRGKVLGRCILS